MLSPFFRYRIYLLLAAAIFLFLSYWFSDNGGSERELKNAVVSTEKDIASLTSGFYKLFTDEFVDTAFSYKKLSKQDILFFQTLPYSVLVYKNDTLKFWSNNKMVPSFLPETFGGINSFYDFKNGYYLGIKKKVSVRPDKVVTVVALAEIKSDYSTHNSYLTNQFYEPFNLPPYFILSAKENDGFLPVKSVDGQTLFYLGIDEAEKNNRAGALATICFFAAMILLILFIHFALKNLDEQGKRWWGLVTLPVVFFAVTLFLANESLLPREVQNWRIFKPELFASGGIANSLGALLIQMLLMLWISIYISGNMHFRFRFETNSVWNFLLYLCGYLLIFIMVAYCVNVFRALVRDSLIEFAFLNPLEPDVFSILGVLCIALFLFCLFLLSEKIIATLQKKKLPAGDHILLLLICSLLTIAYFLVFGSGINGLLIIAWVNIFILLLPKFAVGNIGNLNITRVFLAVVFFCLSGALLLFYYGSQKEIQTRQTFAKKLINDRDAVTEFLLTEAQHRIKADPFINEYFKSGQLSNKELNDRIRQLYFLEGFERYSVKVFPFNTNGFLMQSAGSDERIITERGIKQNVNSIGIDKLFYSSSPTGNITYLAQYDIENRDTVIGRLYIELSANAYNKAGVYPELLLSEKDKLPSLTPAYSYAIYHKPENTESLRDGDTGFRLMNAQGVFTYEYKLSWNIDPQTEYQTIDDNGSNHLIFHPKRDILIVVTSNKEPALYFLSYFSFLFVVIFILVMTILVINQIVFNPKVKNLSDLLQYASLRSLIHAFFLAFVMVILFVIGYVTGGFFLREFNTLAKATVAEKMNRVAQTVSYLMKENDYSDQTDQQISVLLKNHISQFAEVQGNEVNFYNRNGDLISSSQPGIFEKGIISRKINPLAFYDLRKESLTMVVTEEQIGKLKYFSGYKSVRDPHGRVLVYLNLPYYNSRSILNDQAGFFFIALVNILVIATIIAGLMAPFISRQITKKLSVIGEKFRQVKVGSYNELIEWHANDEIGSLVNEYNKMIIELKKSADRLVHSEREMAWREMAKQVAHEIKNPLTPMKLSIQHLQRAYSQNAPNLKELTAGVSKTLIEQIDNLSEIATEFSNFAKMPKADIENVDVHELLLSVCELHKEAGTAKLFMHNNASDTIVAADKNQLISVFNNLMINAIQAIPESRMGRVEVITENNDSQLIVSITDDGVGISEEEGEKVFVPNFTTKSSGTGLGLAICKNIIENINGSISFTSKKNVGTTFFVKLPVVLSEKNN